MPYDFIDLGQHWHRQCSRTAPSQYLNQCWLPCITSGFCCNRTTYIPQEIRIISICKIMSHLPGTNELFHFLFHPSWINNCFRLSHLCPFIFTVWRREPHFITPHTKETYLYMYYVDPITGIYLCHPNGCDIHHSWHTTYGRQNQNMANLEHKYWKFIIAKL